MARTPRIPASIDSSDKASHNGTHQAEGHDNDIREADVNDARFVGKEDHLGHKKAMKPWSCQKRVCRDARTPEADAP